MRTAPTFGLNVDTTIPEITGFCDGLYKGNGFGHSDQNGVFNGSFVPGPLTGLFASADTVSANPLSGGQGGNPTPGAAMLRGWLGGPWLFSTPIDVVFETDRTDNGTSGNVQLQDLAGNESNAQHNAFHSNHFFGTVIDNVRYQWNTSPFFYADSPTHIVNPKADQSILGRGTQYNPNEPIFFIIPPLSPATAGMDDLTINNQPCVALTPLWSSPRQYSYKLTGTFPYANFDKATATYYNGISGMPTGTSDQGYQPPPASNPILLSYFILDQGVQQKSTTQFTGTAQLDTNTNNLLQPGIPVLSVTYNGARFGGITSRNLPTGHFCTNPFDGLPYAESKFESWRTNGFTSFDTFQKARGFAVMQVSPETLVAGKTQKVHIRGYFGNTFASGASLPVTFAASGGSGEIDVVGEGVATLTPSGNGKLVQEDPFNTTALQTVDVMVRPTADAQGIFRITVEGSTTFQLANMVRVIKFDLIADANHDGELDGNDTPAKDAPGGVIMGAGSGFRTTPRQATAWR